MKHRDARHVVSLIPALAILVSFTMPLAGADAVKEAPALPAVESDTKATEAVPFKPVIPVRSYAKAMEIAKEELPGRIDRILAVLNELAANHRQTTGEQLSHLPAAALPLLRQALKRDELSWVAAASLTKAIELIERREAGLQMTAAENERWKEARQSIVESYLQKGHRDPKWDRLVIQAFEIWALYSAEAPTKHRGMDHQMKELLEDALDQGCNDPLVWYCYFTQYHNMNMSLPKRYQKDEYCGFSFAADQMAKSDYPVLRKYYAMTKAARVGHLYECAQVKKNPKVTPMSERYAEYLAQGRKLLLEALATGSLSDDNVVDAIDYLLDGVAESAGKREEAFAVILPLVEKHYPGTGLAEVVQGHYYSAWAWDARGTGFAGTVTEEGWQLYHERIALCKDVLTKAMKKHPQQAMIPAKLMTALMVGGGTEEEIEACLQAFARRSTGDYKTVNMLCSFLHPKWGGSWDAMLGIARQALLTGNWEDRLPQLLIDVHLMYSRTVGRTLAAQLDYYADPEVWKDHELICENLLKWFPGDRAVMSMYVLAACGAQRWDIAHGLFEKLGDAPDFRYIQDHQGYRDLKYKAAGQFRKLVTIDAKMLANDETLRELMIKRKWNLDYFSPGAKTRRHVQWTFSDDGRLSDRVQTTWAIKDGVLETYTNEKKVTNRWKFNKTTHRWENMANAGEDDEKNGYIVPLEDR